MWLFIGRNISENKNNPFQISITDCIVSGETNIRSFKIVVFLWFSFHERHQSRCALNVFLIGWIWPPLLLCECIEHWSTDFHEQDCCKDWRDHRQIFVITHHCRGRYVKPGWHEHFSEVIRMSAVIPQTSGNEFTLKENTSKQVFSTFGLLLKYNYQ